jgi:putative transposase
MDSGERKSLIDSKFEELEVKAQCDLLGLPRSTFYYRSVSASEQDLAAMRTLDELYQEDPTRGTRRMSNELQKQGFDMGRDKTRRLMQRMRMKTIYCRPRTTVCDPAKYKFPYLLRNLKITRPNQVWALDISYIPMERGYMYLLVIMDWHSRAVVGWSLSNTMEASWVVETLKFAIERFGQPEIVNSDQGSQFTSDEYVAFVKGQGIQISMDGKGRAIDNVIVERFFRTIKYDKLYLESLETGAEVQRACHEFIHYYNHKRDHSSIGNQPPMVFYKLAA